MREDAAAISRDGSRGSLARRSDTSNDATETIIVDLVEILEKGRLERDPVLQVGDLIVVPERLINF